MDGLPIVQDQPRCMHDQGPKFEGQGFTQVLEQHGIKNVSMTIKNPQANAVCKQMRQTAGAVLHTLCHVNPPHKMCWKHQI